MRKVYLYLLIIALFISSSVAKDKITLQLDWLHQFQFAGYYMAKEKGFYKAKGLDVTINQFDFSTNLLDHVLQNDAAYAVGKSSLIIDKMSGLDIVALMAIYQHSPMVLLTRKDSGIKHPKDLLQKKVMLTPDARTAVAINSMISSQGIKLSDVKFEPHSFKLDDLINKKTDAMGCYLSNEPFILKQKGVEFNILDPRDYGFDFYGGLLFASKKELKEHPQRVRDFYDATLKGWHYAFTHINETAQTIFDKYNSQKKSLESLIFEGETLSELAEYKNGKLGEISFKKYNEILKIYSLLGYEHDSRVLNDFIYNPSSIILTKEEKNYLEKNTITYKASNIKPYTINGKKGLEFEYLDLIKELIPINITTTQNNNAHMQLALTQTKDTLVTNALTQYPFAIVTNSNINYIQSIKNLRNKKVAIVTNSFFEQQFQKQYNNILFMSVDNIQKALELLNKNEVFAVIHSMPSVLESITQNEFKTVKISGMTAVKHDIKFEVNNEILQSILNKAINKISSNQINDINAILLAPKQQVKKTDNGSWYKFGIPLVIIILIVLFFNKKLHKESQLRQELEENVKEISNTDELTNIYNRKMSLSMLQNSIEISKRYDRPLCMILFDIDDFKKINEDYSYTIGDLVLQELSSVIQSNIRTTDILGRWEGEEFILILPEINISQAQTIAEHLRDIIYNYDFEKLKTYVTCSFAVVEYEKDEERDALVQRASKLLEEIKTAKKNSVKVG